MTRTRARSLRWLAVVCLVAGAATICSSALWVARTDVAAQQAQTAALAAWDPGVGRAPSGRQSAAASGAFVLRIPRLKLERFVPEGASPAHLDRYGVGHLSWTATPGHPGIVGIAGHRTTYGAPFFHLDTLRPGDVIAVDYRGTHYVYDVTGSETVRPDDTAVLEASGLNAEVALVTCTPPYSAAYRLVVFGSLQRVAAIVSGGAAR